MPSYKPNDRWSQKAAAQGYRARSVFKLQELDERFRLLRPGMSVVDIGAAPGSWLQYVSEKIGPKGKAFGIDLQPIEKIDDNVHTTVADLEDTPAVQQFLQKFDVQAVDVVLSDIAPNTSGIKDIDQWRSVELSQAALELAETILVAGGKCVLKVFRGADFDEWLREVRTTWKLVKVFQAKVSRKSSREVYVVLQKLGK